MNRDPGIAAEQTEALPNPAKIGRVRWWIVWTLFLSTTINYISRQTFSVLSPLIAAQYHLTSHGPGLDILGRFRFPMPSHGFSAASFLTP